MNIHNPSGFQRVQPGAQVGVPPSLEQVPVDRLHVDSAYQRATDGAASRRIIVEMVKQWDWSLCQPLVVARRSDGSLFILDGQHRHAGAVERGDINFLPCVILSTLDHAGEARTFVKLNTQRQKLTQAEIFHGQLAAGDKHARIVQQLLDATGWKVMRHRNYAAYSPGELECAPMLVRVVAAKGEDIALFALTVLRQAYPTRPVRVAATLLKALFALFEQAGEDSPFSTAPLINALAAAEPTEWVTRGALQQHKNSKLSQTTAIAKAMLEAATPPVPSPAPAPAARTLTPGPAPTTPAFGTSGKGWCDQCQQLRSRDAARACQSPFCKLRSIA